MENNNIKHTATFKPTIKEWDFEILDLLDEAMVPCKVFISKVNGRDAITRILFTTTINEDNKLEDGQYYRNDDLDYVSELIGSGSLTIRHQYRDSKPTLNKYIVEAGYAYPIRFGGPAKRRGEIVAFDGTHYFRE